MTKERTRLHPEVELCCQASHLTLQDALRILYRNLSEPAEQTIPTVFLIENQIAMGIERNARRSRGRHVPPSVRVNQGMVETIENGCLIAIQYA
jgi:hypothetical protein